MKTISQLVSLFVLLLVLQSHAETANVALNGAAYSNHPLWGPGNWNINMIIDGDRAGVLHGDTATEPGADYTVDLGKDYPVQEVKIYPRQDGCCPDRLANFRLSVNKDDGAGNLGAEVWGTNLFATGNAGSTAGTVVSVKTPAPQTGRWIQIKSLANPVPDYALQMTEVEVLADVPASEVNRAVNALATSNRLLYGGANPAALVDGRRTTIVHGTNSQPAGFAYSINLGATVNLSRLVIWARQDGCCPDRLSNYRVSIHKDNAGKVGDSVWQADMHTDLSNPGSDRGSKDTLTASLHAAGQFKGQWIVITSLDNPVPDYALQLAEVEAYGAIEGAATLLITQQPASVAVGPAQPATFSVAASVLGGDPTKITYQWQKSGTNIVGATNATYSTPPLQLSDEGKKFRVVISYPGLTNSISDEATVRLNLAYKTQAYSNRPLWGPGGWNISQIVDGNRTSPIHGDTAIEPGMAYQIDLGTSVTMTEVNIFPRQDGCCPERLSNIRVSVHKDGTNKIGDAVWTADLFTDGTNPGASAGSVIKLVATNGVGKFEGQWIQILSLEDPEPNYTMQMTEVEVYGSYTGGNPVLQVVRHPADFGSVPGRVANFSIEAKIVNGDSTRITYQWQKNGTNISGANATNYVSPPLIEADAGSTYRVVISYPNIPSLTTSNAVVSFDYNYAKGQPTTSNRPLWGPGGWNIGMIVDGNRGNVLHGDVKPGLDFAYTINLGVPVNIERIDIYPRQDGCCPERLANIRLSVHKDNAGQIGDRVWSADLFADGSNAGSGPGTVVQVSKEADPAGVFQGQWVRIATLDDPVPDYFLQMTEVEVIGKAVPVAAAPNLAVARNGNSIVLSWAANVTGFVLETSDKLPATSWTAVPGVVNNQVTIPIASGKRFYRLRSP